MSRRQFLAISAALGVGAACSKAGLQAAPAGDAGASTLRLRILNWALYIDTDQPPGSGTGIPRTKELSAPEPSGPPGTPSDLDRRRGAGRERPALRGDRE